jgi:hypothetical protein
VAAGRGGRNAGEQASRPANARAERVQGMRVEAFVVLEFEEGRWTVGRTSELRPAVTAGAEG